SSHFWGWSEDEIFAGSLLLAYVSSNGIRDYGVDHLGSTVVVTDPNAHLIGNIYYDAFGAGGATGAGMLQYTGHERDGANAGAQTGPVRLPDYLHARNYDSLRGRFLSPDRAQNWFKAMSIPQAWNRYTYARNNPLCLLDSNGTDDKDFRMLTVHINVIYSNADVKTISGQTLRQATEEGIAYSRKFFADARIQLDVRRYEGTINTQAWGNINGPVKTSNGDVALEDFQNSHRGALTVLVSGDLSGISGKTHGIGGPTMIGTGSDKMVFNDEISHALGNVTTPDVPLLSNTLADIRLDAQETFVELGWGMSQWYKDTFRQTLEIINGELQ
ncbi:MAG: RHS repeat-associated core domain-containing protein, partial [Thermoanaerobaculia bacterium]